MANIKITDLTAYTDPLNTDVLPIVDVTSDTTKKVSIADLLKNAGSGTAAAPGIAFDGDSNTGIYRPGADQVAISTNGQGRLFVDEYGNVGINNSSSSYALSAGATGTSTVEIKAGGTTNLSRLLFSDSNTIGPGYIWYSHADNSLQFGANSAERLRITSDGKLGVGTATPSELLTVWGGNILTDANSRKIGFKLTGNTNAGYLIPYDSSGNTQLVNERSSGNLIFKTANTERLRITSDGKLGLGTSSPGNLLTLAVPFNSGDSTYAGGQSTATNSFRNFEWGHRVIGEASESLNGRAAVQFRLNPGAGGSDSEIRFITNQYGYSRSERMTITSTGKVGIGTTSPSSHNSINRLLNIDGATNAKTGISLSEASANYFDIYFDGSNNEAHIDQSAGGGLVFTSGANEAFRVDSSQRLLVGTSTARTNYFNTSTYGPLLNLEGTSNSNRVLSFVHNDNSGAPILVLGATGGSSAGSNSLISSSGSCGILSFQGADGSELVEAARIACDIDSTPGANDMPGRLVFSTTADGASSPTARMTIKNNGNVGIGTESPSNNLVIAGQGDTVQIIDARRNAANGSIAGIQLWSKSAAGVNNYGFISYDGDDKMQIGTAGSGDGSIDIAFAGANGEAMRIDSSGRLLVGTSSTSEAARAIIQGNSFSASGGSLLKLSRGNATPNDGGDLGNIHFTDSSHRFAANISALRDGGTWTSGSSQPTRLVFSTTADGASSPTERMRIGNDGDVLIGATTLISQSTSTGSGVRITKNGQQFSIADGSPAFFIGRNTSDGNSVDFRRAGVQVGTISVTASATSFNTSSDYRLKENVVPLTGAANRLKQIPVHRFNFIADPDTTVDGFIAHEAQAVVPEAVTGTHNEVDADGNPVYQGIDQSKLVPLLTAALQEALAKIETLEQRLSDAGIA